MMLLIDKPKGITSHDVVDRVRKITGERRVGHGGTLDPNATGLLIVGVGREDTKKLGDITTKTRKTYIGELTLGVSTTTDDTEGDIVETKPVPELTIEEVAAVLKQFVGPQQQMPPIYSAIKQNGQKAYELARKGIAMKLLPRDVEVFSLTIVSFEAPLLTVECDVSSGTYIRSLARDIGIALGTVAHLSNLRRTKVGTFDVTDAVTLEKLESEKV